MTEEINAARETGDPRAILRAAMVGMLLVASYTADEALGFLDYRLDQLFG